MNRRLWSITLLGMLFLLFSVSDASSTSKQMVRCVVGQIGLGGGTVFYDAGSQQKWGQCLEAAPMQWSGKAQDPKAPWCNVFNVFFSDAVASRSYIGTAIGKGSANTNLLMISGCKSGAGVLAHAYHGGGKTDWFLPSKNELHAMYLNRAVIGGLGDGVYWSSSENDANGAWIHYFHTKGQYLRFKGIANSVRPIRAF
jgi:hypothetical protein